MKNTKASSEQEITKNLRKKIVTIPYSETLSSSETKRSATHVDEKKILKLARKIRETYDYNDVALNGAN